MLGELHRRVESVLWAVLRILRRTPRPLIGRIEIHTGPRISLSPSHLQPRRLLALTAVGVLAFATSTACGEGITLRVGHFPNITHVQALVARNFERQGRSWFAPRLAARRIPPPAIPFEWRSFFAFAFRHPSREIIEGLYLGPAGVKRRVTGLVNGGTTPGSGQTLLHRGRARQAPPPHSHTPYASVRRSLPAPVG